MSVSKKKKTNAVEKKKNLTWQKINLCFEWINVNVIEILILDGFYKDKLM